MVMPSPKINSSSYAAALEQLEVTDMTQGEYSMDDAIDVVIAYSMGGSKRQAEPGSCRWAGIPS